MINPGSHDFVVYQGCTLRKTFTWIANNAPVNLTGWTGRCQFRETINSAEPALNLTTLNGGVLVDGLAGTITLYATDVATSALTKDRYVYDVELVDPAGDVIRLVQGAVSLSRGITR